MLEDSNEKRTNARGDTFGSQGNHDINQSLGCWDKCIYVCKLGMESVILLLTEGIVVRSLFLSD